MKTSTPVQKPCMQPYLNVRNAEKAIEFYKQVFEATEIGRITMYGKVGHAELTIGDSRFMVAEEMPEWGNKSPESLGGTPVTICLYVEDVDKTYQKALDAGGKTEGNMGVKDQFYGDRSGNLIDPFGHKWVISTHIEDLNYNELQKRSDKMTDTNKNA